MLSLSRQHSEHARFAATDGAHVVPSAPMQRWISSFAFTAVCLTGFSQTALAEPVLGTHLGTLETTTPSQDASPRVAPVLPDGAEALKARALDHVRSAIAEQAEHVVDNTSALVSTAMGFLGVRYRLGGNSAETGFDCSGFVRAIYQKTAGLVLPRQAKDQAASTEVIDKSDLKPGDLVFFNTMRRAFSHVGVYLGDGKFIHSPRTGQQVRVESLQTSYWQKRFNGARRVALDDTASSKLALATSTTSTRNTR